MEEKVNPVQGNGTRKARIGRLAVASLPLIASATLLSAGPASADGNSCSFAPNGYVCLNVYGTDRYVHDVKVIRTLPSAQGICKYQARYYYTSSAGTRLDSRWGVYHAGCTPLRVEISFNLAKTYSANGYACGEFYEDDDLQGTSCVHVYVD
jgi:hypothetical protein